MLIVCWLIFTLLDVLRKFIVDLFWHNSSTRIDYIIQVNLWIALVTRFQSMCQEAFVHNTQKMHFCSQTNFHHLNHTANTPPITTKQINLSMTSRNPWFKQWYTTAIASGTKLFSQLSYLICLNIKLLGCTSQRTNIFLAFPQIAQGL
jgi:hypothetical protein